MNLLMKKGKGMIREHLISLFKIRRGYIYGEMGEEAQDSEEEVRIAPKGPGSKGLPLRAGPE